MKELTLEYWAWNWRKITVLLTGNIICLYCGKQVEVIDKPNGDDDFICHNSFCRVYGKIFNSET
jgi:hypothetical protein